MSYFTSPTNESSFGSSSIFASTSNSSYTTPFGLFIPAAQSPREMHGNIRAADPKLWLWLHNGQKKTVSGLGLKKLWKGFS
ncbi:hypothetical protein BT96DRAFT_912838 [Gymnopus androsaceus JB14]|uniref:Uncharacterized protein n=1 Tax=Gymnopus androsaceus JB14 TaxID=1447944 RepID=A0A6A4IIY9_9AGAR|nr:hypothetical protein BT96DRAFT_912838 [Gymnopus androsaceus JB14]